VECQVEGCLCKQTNQPITEAVYGERQRRRKPSYESRGGTTAIWRSVSIDDLQRLANRFAPARKFAARRRKEDAR